ncbi:MAG: SusE domain-containing protein [Sphingobacterium composti]
MKKLINIILSLYMLVFMYSCKTDNMNYSDAQVTAVNALYAPTENASVKLVSAASASLFFEWEPAKTEDSGAALYEIVFDKVGGNFSQPIYRMTSNNNGYLSNAIVSHKILNSIAISAGANPGESVDIVWSIISSRGMNQVLSNQSRKLNITTLEGFADVPNEVFVTGEGSETGADINASMPFKQIAPGEFEIYTKLEAGKKYVFIDRKGGTPRYFYSDDQVKLKEGTDESGMQVSKTGVYKISIDFNVATISTIEITKVGMFFSPSNSVVVNMPYAGNGIFRGTGVVNFKQESWGRDQRYKFQFEYIENGATKIGQFGTKNSTDNPPNASSAPSYYFIRVLPNNSQWDDKWKFIDAVDGKSTTISIILQGDKDYTHTVTVN